MDLLKQNLISGAFSGFLSLSIYVPGDLLKCRAQIRKDKNFSYMKEIQLIVKSEGIKGLYRGFMITALRDIPGWGIYFATYEKLK